MYEQQIAALEGSQFTMENIQMQSDMMRDQVSILKVMQESSNAQKQLMGGMDSDAMYDMALDMKEMQSNMEEMNEIFTESYKVDMDDGDLDAELDELDFENMDKGFSVADISKPNKKVLSKKEQYEKALENELMF